ncbi:MAG: LuxR C-terminal-related transcriptional regulator [Bacteroidales bacterium]|jgi:DNA-binding CsgD family transcriptional regulator|nr:LuxR C-terminal-related transcriptional regulator [Bacteroidales bacterium]
MMPSDQYIRFFRDYSEKLRRVDCREESFELLERYLLLPSQAIYLLDRRSMSIPYKRGIERLLGYSDDEFNINLIAGYVHPDDSERYVYLTKLTNEWGRAINPEPFSVEVQIDYRVRKKDGSYIKVIRQSTNFENCVDKSIKSAINILTDITQIKTDNSVNLSVFNVKTGKVLLEEKDTLPMTFRFSKREMEILRLLKIGMRSSEIAGRLFISRHTVDTHRRKMLEKTGCKNIMELVHHASRLGII